MGGYTDGMNNHIFMTDAALVHDLMTFLEIYRVLSSGVQTYERIKEDAFVLKVVVPFNEN